MNPQPQHPVTSLDERPGWITGQLGAQSQPAAEWLGWDAWVSVDPDFLSGDRLS